jgi:ABC-type thiamine transport system substrate-binding protein
VSISARISKVKVEKARFDMNSMSETLAQAPNGNKFEAERQRIVDYEAFTPQVFQSKEYVVLPEEIKSVEAVSTKNVSTNGCVTSAPLVQHNVLKGEEAAVSNEHATLPATIEITLPDMFVSFMAVQPKINPHYERVRAESEAWIIE